MYRLNVGVIIFLFDGLVILIASRVISSTALLYSSFTIALIGLSTFLCTCRLHQVRH